MTQLAFCRVSISEALCSKVGAWLVMHISNFTPSFILSSMLVAFQTFSGRLSGSVKRLSDVMNAPAEPMTMIPTRANVNQATNLSQTQINN